MKNKTKIQIKMALHVVVIPMILLLAVAIFDKQYSLIVALAHIVLMNFVFFRRAKVNNDITQYQLEWRMFKDTLLAVSAILMFIVVVIIALAM